MSDQGDTSVSEPDIKHSLECEKLQAEIESIRRPVYKTPGFYSAIAPVVLAFLGIIFTWSTGWFDVQKTRISNDKTLLEAQTERLRMERASLESQTLQQHERYRKAEAEIQKLKVRESELTNEVALLTAQRVELEKLKEFLERELKRLAGADEKVVEFLRQINDLKSKRDLLGSQVAQLQNSNIALVQITFRQSEIIQWANEVLDAGRTIALKDRSTWLKFRDFVAEAKVVKFVSNEFLPPWQVETVTITNGKALQIDNYMDALRDDTIAMVGRASRKSTDYFLHEALNRPELIKHAVKWNAANQINKMDDQSPSTK